MVSIVGYGQLAKSSLYVPLKGQEKITNSKLFERHCFDLEFMSVNGFTFYKSPTFNLAFIYNMRPFQILLDTTCLNKKILGAPLMLQVIDVRKAVEIGFMQIVLHSEKGEGHSDRYISPKQFEPLDRGILLTNISEIIGKDIEELCIEQHWDWASPALLLHRKYREYRIGPAMNAIMGAMAVRWFDCTHLRVHSVAPAFHDSVFRDGIIKERYSYDINAHYDIDLSKVTDFLPPVSLIA